MRLKKVLIVFVFCLLIIIPVTYAAEPDVTATSAVTMDCIDGKILYSKQMNDKLYPASLTKVLTAIVVAENANLDDKVTMTESAISHVQSGYLTSGIKVGETFTVQELLNLLLISSYNDISNVLAEHVAGSSEQFVSLMNEKAKEIRMYK